MNGEFSYKFEDARSKKNFQILKESFSTSEDLSSTGRQSFEKGMKRKVQANHAWAIKPKLTNESKVNPSLVEP